MMEENLPRQLPKCRLCQCPIADGGVFLQDSEKLSNWMYTYRNEQVVEKWTDSTWVCVFCTREARAVHEFREGIDDLVWWPQVFDPYYGYYLKGWMKPCSVQLEKLAAEEIVESVHGIESKEDSSSQKYLNTEDIKVEYDSAGETEVDVRIKLEKEDSAEEMDSAALEESAEEMESSELADESAKLRAVRSFLYKKKKCQENPVELSSVEMVLIVSSVQLLQSSSPCNICGISFKRLNLLKSHQESHKCQGKLNVEEFVKRAKITNYSMNGKSNNKLSCLCNQCRYSSSNPVDMRAHILTRHMFCLCKVCEKTFRGEIRLREHLKEEHGILKLVLQCLDCHCPKLKTKTAAELAKHMEEKHQNNRKIEKACYLCGICQYVSNERSDFANHLKLNHKDNPIACRYCGERFMKCNHSIHQKFCAKALLKCKYCSLILPNNMALITHSQSHTKVKEKERHLQCSHCMFSSTSALELVNHSKLHDSYLNLSKPVCIKCGFKFRTGKLKMEHDCCEYIMNVSCKFCCTMIGQDFLKEHQEEKSCIICDSKFPCQMFLDYHMLEMKRHCKVCDLLFCWADSYDSHLTSNHQNISHSIVSPCFCDECKMFFKDLHSYLRHKNERHAPIFICKICGRGFLNIEDTEEHVAEDHSIDISRLTGCHDCSILFKNKVDLQKHLQSGHTKSGPQGTTAYCLKIKFKTYLICQQCGFEFESDDKLKTHWWNEHMPSGPKKVKLLCYALKEHSYAKSPYASRSDSKHRFRCKGRSVV